MKIGVVGASGLVGRKILKQLQNLNYKFEIFPYTSKKSSGQIIDGYQMIELKDENIIPLNYVLFSAGGDVSKQWANKFIEKGATVIDNSNAFRRNPFVPLVVPEINSHSLFLNTKLIANPNCSTIQIALPLYCLNELNPIRRIVVSTYQSASGAGQKGLNDLDNKTANKFPHTLHDDLLPQIDIALENNFTLEEDKIRFELRKILEIPSLMVNATAVRVPIHYCHGASVYVECKNQVDINLFKEKLTLFKGIKVLDDLKSSIYPLAKIATDTDLVYVGRIRQDLDKKNALSFWALADNLRKGAATNAVQILESLININS